MGRAIGNIVGTVAPIAAGYMFPGFGTAMGLGSGIAAGALAGAGIAALTGDDPLMGAVGGGLGGYGGGGFRTAADATKATQAGLGGGTNAGVNSMMNNPALTTPGYTAPQFTKGGIGDFGFTGQGLNTTTGGGYDALTGIGGGINPTAMQSASAGLDSAKAAFDTPSAFIENLGGGDKVAGYGKLALTSAPVVGAALEPEYETFEDVMSEDVYDPNSQLNLNMDTGIKEALKKDSGLRLYAEGGDVGGGVTGAGLAPGTPVAGAVSETISGPGGTESFSEMVASGIHPANAAAMLGMDTAPYLDTGPGMEFTGTPSTPTSSGIGALPPPPAPFTPETGFDYETYTGSYMAPGGMKTPVGIGTGGYPSPVGPGITKSRFEEMIRKGYASGGYLDGGMLPGDGMSDDVPAMIDGTQKAALSQGEFVVPADVVVI